MYNFIFLSYGHILYMLYIVCFVQNISMGKVSGIAKSKEVVLWALSMHITPTSIDTSVIKVK